MSAAATSHVFKSIDQHLDTWLARYGRAVADRTPGAVPPPAVPVKGPAGFTAPTPETAASSLAAAEQAAAAARRAEAAVAQQAATIERLDAQLSTLHHAWRGDVARLEEQVQRQREALDRALGDRLKLQQTQTALQARVEALERVALGRVQTSPPPMAADTAPPGVPTHEVIGGASTATPPPLELPQAVADILAAAGVPPPCVVSASVPCISAADLVSILRVAPHVRAAVEPTVLPPAGSNDASPYGSGTHTTPKASHARPTGPSSRGSSPAATHLANVRAAFLYGAAAAPAPAAPFSAGRSPDEGQGAAFGVVADAAATAAVAAQVAAAVFPPPLRVSKQPEDVLLRTPATSHQAAAPAPLSPPLHNLDTSEVTRVSKQVTAWGGMRPQSGSSSGESSSGSYHPSTTPSVSRGGRASSRSATRSDGTASTPSATRQRLDVLRSAFKGAPVTPTSGVAASVRDQEESSHALGSRRLSSSPESATGHSPAVAIEAPMNFDIETESPNADVATKSIAAPGAPDAFDASAFPDPPHAMVAPEASASVRDGSTASSESPQVGSAPASDAMMGAMPPRAALRDSSSPSTDFSDGDVARRILSRRGARGLVAAVPAAAVTRPASHHAEAKPTQIGTARADDSDEEW